MKIRTATANHKILNKLCDDVLRNRVFVQRYGLFAGGIRTFVTVKRGMIEKIAVAYDDDGTPIGSAIISNHKLTQAVQVFVRKKHRKQGIGRQLIRKLRPNQFQKVFFGTSSHRFYEKFKGFEMY